MVTPVVTRTVEKPVFRTVEKVVEKSVPHVIERVIEKPRYEHDDFMRKLDKLEDKIIDIHKKEPKIVAQEPEEPEIEEVPVVYNSCGCPSNSYTCSCP